MPIEELALQFCFDLDVACVTLTGMVTAALVKNNLRALTAPRHPALTMRLRTLLRQGGAEELWPSGLRENWNAETSEIEG